METRIYFAGLSEYFYFLIPAALGLTALYWLWFCEGAHKFRRLLSQEKRHAEIVGARPLPKKSLQIDIESKRDSRVVIDRAEIDGHDIWVYCTNVSGGDLTYVKVAWKLVAPDGTIVAQNYHFINTANPLGSGERIEKKLWCATDPRASTLKLSVFT